MQDSSKTMVAVVRDIGTIEREIQVLKDQSARIVLSYAIEVGRRLCEAKEMLPHGEWGSWLKQRAGFSQSTANNMMRLFEEYGADQLTLFGAIPNSQALGNLSYTKAISLLALPAEERDEVLKTNDVEAMSTRELERLIREKKEAEDKASAAQEALEAEKKRAQAALDERDVAEAREEKAVKRAEEYESVAKDASNKLFALQDRLKEAERRLQAADGQAAELAREQARSAAQAEIELLKGRIKEAQDAAEAAKQEAQKAAEAAKQEAQAQIGELQARVEQAAALTKDSKEEAERLRHEIEQLKARDRRDSRVPEFKAIFVRVQGEVSALKKLIGDIRADDPETAGKLESAMKKFAEVMAK